MEFIIPSMWRKPSFTIAALEYYISIKEITKLIIIDNDINKTNNENVKKVLKVLNWTWENSFIINKNYQQILSLLQEKYQTY